MKFQFPELLGKYRDLLIAIALFVLIDLGVLVFNYQSSRLLEIDSGRINLASDMRAFSQQLAKAVLTLKQEYDSGTPTQTSLAQVSEAYSGYSQATESLLDGLSQSRQEMFDDQARIERARVMLSDSNKTWRPLAQSLSPLLAPGSGFPGGATADDVGVAVNKVVARNTRLMQQAEDLTRNLEEMSVHRASQMRFVQVLGILLALINFAFIVIKFLRGLARSDRVADLARKETDQILGSVREGLFLLERNGAVGRQQSKSTANLLGCKLSAGDSLYAYLSKRMSEEGVTAAENYMTVLFNERVKPSLLKQLNPLREVELQMSDGSRRFLDFEFQQVLHGRTVKYLLVSVSDITENVLLSRELEGSKAQARSGVEDLISVLEHDPRDVTVFLDAADRRLLEINNALQKVSPAQTAYRQLISRIAREVHCIKGEAAMLDLCLLERSAHEFEETLVPLRDSCKISGDALIPVAVALSNLREDVEQLKRVVARMRSFSADTQAVQERPLKEVIQHIEQLTLRVASELNKKVRFEARLPDTELPISLVSALREALPQLIRNAVAHGIEACEERQRSGKPEEGLIRCSVDVGTEGQLIIAVEDDGRGIDPHRLRECVIAKGLKTADEVATMSDEDVVALIFTPGFSSFDDLHDALSLDDGQVSANGASRLAQSSVHAGRGEGLSVVKEVAERLGARLQISSRPERYTRFALLMRDNRWLFA